MSNQPDLLTRIDLKEGNDIVREAAQLLMEDDGRPNTTVPPLAQN